MVVPENLGLKTAGPDPTFLDDRCLANLLRAEDKVEESCGLVAGPVDALVGSYFADQKDITPAMRKIVAEWMMEVSSGAIFIKRGISEN